MLDSNYKFAELTDHTDALESIRKLEQRLTDQTGSPISLIAYEFEQEEL
ncbi:MAG: hypothetical protein ACE3L7_04530 [Candidatus Pristimantibacillus sp.]